MKQLSFKIKEDVTQINVYKIPAETCFLSLLFSRFFLENIEIDMISRPLTHTFNTQLSFTVDDLKLKNAVKILTELKQEYKDLKFSVCASNSKVTLSSENLNKLSFLSSLFDKFCALNIEILLICASEKEISLLVSNSSILTAEYAIEEIVNEQKSFL